jgi:hypothetical protein
MLPAASASRSDETNTPTPISTIGAPERSPGELISTSSHGCPAARSRCAT